MAAHKDYFSKGTEIQHSQKQSVTGLIQAMRQLKPLKLMTVLAAGLIIAACGKEEGEKKEIVFGLGPSIYVDQVEGGIIPQLEKEGYTVTTRIFRITRKYRRRLKMRLWMYLSILALQTFMR